MYRPTTRPMSVSAASWIWLFCGVFSSFTIANILTTTSVMEVLTGLSIDPADLAAVEVISWAGWAIAGVVLVLMVLQVIGAVMLRDGARWARVVLTVAAAASLVALIYDFTLWTAWVVMSANVVAMFLAWGDTASDYLELPDQETVTA